MGQRIIRRYSRLLSALVVLAMAGCATGAPTGAPAPQTSPGAGSPVAGSSPVASPGGGGTASIRIPAGTRWSIATGGTGGIYFPLGGSLASLLQRQLGVQVTAEVTPASVDNLKLVHDQRREIIAFSLSDTAFDAIEGRAQFRDTGPVQARSLGIVYTNFTHIVTVEGTGINTVQDLRGKRVSVGAAGSGTEIIANRVLEVYGLSPDRDIQRERLGAAESAGALKDRRLDAFFWSGGVPTGAVTDLANTPGLTVKILAHADAVPQLNQRYGNFYTSVTIPRDAYRGMTDDVRVSGVPNILAVHEEFPEDWAYAILATIFDNKAEWDSFHPEARNFQLATAWENNPIPLHPGAIRFYRERGVYRGS